MAQMKIGGDQIDQTTITLTGAALTPTSVAASGTVTGSNLSGTNTGDQTINGLLPSQTGNNGKFLKTDGSNVSWDAPAGSGTVTSVAMSVPSFLSVAGSPVTTTGTLAVTLSGTALPAVNGGTGQTGFAVGDILYASSTTALSKLVVGSNGQVLTLASGVPSWAAAAGGTSYALQPVRVATTANGTLATAFANGSTVDGVVLATGDRILLKNQTTTTDNGIYTVNASGAPTRAADFTTGAATLTGGVIIGVIAGTRFGGSIFQCMNTSTITIGSTAPVFRVASGIVVNGLAALTEPIAAGTSGAIAIGSSASAGGAGGVAIGPSANAASTNTVSIGSGSSTSGTGAIGIGGSAGATNSVALGAASSVGSKAGGVAVGYQSLCDFIGEIAFGTGNFSSAGDAKVSYVPMLMTTTNATPTEMSTMAGANATAPTNRIILTNNSTYIFDCQIVARQSTTGTDYAAFQLTFLITREANAAATALVGTPVATSIAATAGAATWTCGVTADTTNGRPNISVTGAAATTIRWVANIRMTKVSG